MMLTYQTRTTISALLALTVVLWGQTGFATLSAGGNGPQCRMPAHHAAMPTVHHNAMAAGCCPGHALSKRDCLSHAAMSVAPDLHPDCCALSGQPDRPTAFLVNSGTSVHLDLAAAAGSPDAIILSNAVRLAAAQAAPLTRPVLDQKADLRI